MNNSRRYTAMMLAAMAMCLTPQISFGQRAKGFPFARPQSVMPQRCFGHCRGH